MPAASLVTPLPLQAQLAGSRFRPKDQAVPPRMSWAAVCPKATRIAPKPDQTQASLQGCLAAREALLKQRLAFFADAQGAADWFCVASCMQGGKFATCLQTTGLSFCHRPCRLSCLAISGYAVPMAGPPNCTSHLRVVSRPAPCTEPGLCRGL